MNKSHFIEFVENPVKLKARDADILAELARNYPYSSLVHTLYAKALQHTEQAKSSLATAALHIPDRSVLKGVMENSVIQPSRESGSIPGQADEPETKAVKVPVTIIPEAANPEVPVTEPKSGNDSSEKASILDELQENLRQLREQRQQFGRQEEEDKDNTPENKSENSSDSPLREKIQQPLPERLQEIIENREEQEIEDPKRKEQINLIDSFIQNSSAIARRYRSLDEQKQEPNDLTSHYSFTPHDLATENLAQIMVRQGKTEKAIDIYEKLILKYPQKRAYFASCIEKLKTSL